MEDLFTAIKIYSSPRYEEDFVDRINFQATPFIFLAATSVVFYQTFFGRPLQCWTPVQFRGGWDEYVNDYCLVENTYFIPFQNRSLPNENKIRDESELTYYQWVSFVLALQTLCFCFPHIVWRMINWISGVQLRAIVSMTVAASKDPKGIDENVLEMLANHLNDGLKMSREQHRSFGVTSNPIAFVVRMMTLKAKCYITFCYFLMKTLFVVNLILQTGIINLFLGIHIGQSFTWGIALLMSIAQGNDWASTGIFPRVTICDFEIRELGNIHRWSVQCVLPLNMFTEKVYIFLWFWLHIVFVLTIINMVIWFKQILHNESRLDFLHKMLYFTKIIEPSFANNIHSEIVKQLYDGLGWDGVLVLRLILSNAGEITCAHITLKLYKKYWEKMNDMQYNNFPGVMSKGASTD